MAPLLPRTMEFLWFIMLSTKASCFLTLQICMGLSNEVQVGKALKGLPREKVQLVTKFGDVVFRVKGSAEYVRKACEDSL